MKPKSQPSPACSTVPSSRRASGFPTPPPHLGIVDHAIDASASMTACSAASIGAGTLRWQGLKSEAVLVVPTTGRSSVASDYT